MTMNLTAYILIALVLFLFSAIKILREYERGVIFLLGKFYKVKGPGVIIVIPGLQKMVKVSLRTVVMDVPPQDIITKDNVTVKVNAVVYFRVLDPRKAIIEVEDFLYATSQICQTTLRSILGQSQLDDLLANREDINIHLQKVIDDQTEPWGVKVANVEVKNVDLPQEMQRALAKRRRRNGNGAPRSSTPSANSKRREKSAMPPTSSIYTRRLCSCGFSRPCWTFRWTKPPPPFFRFPSNCSLPF